MRASPALSLALAGASPAAAATHTLFSGFFSGAAVAALEFDDAAATLRLSANITTQAADGAKWITLDSRRKNLYVATTGAFQSYAVDASDLRSLTYEGNVSLSSDCSNANFISASTTAPYTVFGAPYSTGCSSLAISVNTTSGALTPNGVFANATYDAAAGVHGLALSPDNAFLYSADDSGNAVWTHAVDAAAGTVTAVQKLAAPADANPRHLAVHPNGRWAYVVYEEASAVAVYARDSATGKLTDTNATYSLLPSGFTNSSLYWADEVLLSQPTTGDSPQYVLAATRSRTTTLPGYVSALALDAATGAVTEQLFLTPTTGSGGSANAVAPAGFGEDYFAITDSGDNFVEVWKIDGDAAAPVAHLDLAAGPANVVWYS